VQPTFTRVRINATDRITLGVIDYDTAFRVSSMTVVGEMPNLIS
jgi:hypothetical protein